MARFLLLRNDTGDPSIEAWKGEYMIIATIRMKLPLQKRGEVLKILRTMAEQWRSEPGCLRCNICQDIEEKNVLILKELWESEEELNVHLRSDEYRNLLLVLELAHEPPEIRFDTISSSTGIETIEKARSNARRIL